MTEKTPVPFSGPTPDGNRIDRNSQTFGIQKDAMKNRLRTTTVSDALLVGAQALSAESISFEERSDLVLLLHFWPLTVQVFVPQRVENDGTAEFVGYSLAIPDVADLHRFLDEYPAMLGELSTDVRGYRPTQAVVDLHPGRAQALYTRGELLPVGQDHRGRPRVRREEGP